MDFVGQEKGAGDSGKEAVARALPADGSEGCGATEIVYRFDFPNPPTLLGLWRDYIHEHCRRLGQDVQRVVYCAKHWLRVMGIDATPGAWLQ